MTQETISELIKLSGVIFGSLLTGMFGIWMLVYGQKLKRQNALLKNENSIQKETLESIELIVDLKLFNIIKSCIHEIFSKTKADRFLILYANNKGTELRFATAVYEEHKDSGYVSFSIGAVKKYDHFQFDEAYKNMLKSTEVFNETHYEVALMPEGNLKDIYDAEKIKHSSIYFIKRFPKDEKVDIVVYSSVATHNEEPYTASEKIIIKGQMDVLKNNIKELKEIY